MQGATKIIGGNDAETWKGNILPVGDSETLTAYIKISSQSQSIAECVCSLLGIAAGLNIPQPYFVLVRRDDVPSSDRFPLGASTSLNFASAGKKGISFSSFLTDSEDSASFLIREWKDYDRVMVFDQWIANVDRHTNNVLFDGKDFFPIDHGQALFGSHWRITGLPEHDMDMTNLLFDTKKHIYNHNDISRFSLKRDTEKIMRNKGSLDVAHIINNSNLSILCEQDDMRSIVHFLTNRIYSVASQICKKVGLPALQI